AQLVPVRREHALRFRAAGRSREPVRSPVDVLESRRHADLWPDGAQRLGLLAREGTRRDSSIGAPRLRVPTVFVPVDVLEALLATKLVPVRRQQALRFGAARRTRESMRRPVDVLEMRRPADL